MEFVDHHGQHVGHCVVHTLDPSIGIWVVGAGEHFPNPNKFVDASESFGKSWRPLSEGMLRGHPQRDIYRLMRMLAVPSAVNSAVTVNMSARRLKQSVKRRI